MGEVCVISAKVSIRRIMIRDSVIVNYNDNRNVIASGFDILNTIELVQKKFSSFERVPIACIFIWMFSARTIIDPK